MGWEEGSVRIFSSERWPQLEGAQPWMSRAAGRNAASGGACSARAQVVEVFLSETLSYQDLHWQNEGQWRLHSQGDGTDRQMWAHLSPAVPCPFHTETSDTSPEALGKKRNSVWC